MNLVEKVFSIISYGIIIEKNTKYFFFLQVKDDIIGGPIAYI